MMTTLNTARSRMLLGCGSAALAVSLSLAHSEEARAEAFQASPRVVQGEVFIDREVTNQDIITVFQGPTPVIDWIPFLDNNGNAQIFLPDGRTAIFQNDFQSGDFAVINRILPSPNNDIVQINGTVIGRLQSEAGNVPGGFIVFYSPTGILVGSTASFDIGRLLLTTLDVTGFDPQTQSINLAAGQGPAARIETLPGSQFIGSAENSLVALVGHQVIHSGTINVNGTAAFVAGEQVNLTYNQGLLDITVPVGTDIFEAIIHNGTTGGPSSTGAGDDHMIYAVARAKAEPISMLLSGNLGFAPAQSAGVVNGEIILSANFDVFGRSVAGGTISDGINAEFNLRSPAGTVPATIRITDATVTNSLLAVSTDLVIAEARNAPLTVDGDLLIAGNVSPKGNAANIQAFGSSVNVSGDVLVYSRDIGEIDVEFADPSVINASGGRAGIAAAGAGSAINIAGNLRLDVSATAGQDISNAAAGSAIGGQAQITADSGGAINILGDVSIDSSANGLLEVPALTAGEIRGGQSQLLARDGGSLSIGGSLTSLASAFGVNGDVESNSSGSVAFGGVATLAALSGNIDITGNVVLSARAVAGGSNQAVKGSDADAGIALIGASGQGTMTLGGNVNLDAFGWGGQNRAGEGGDGFGGVAGLLAQDGATLRVAGDLRANAVATGGNGTIGGNAEGGAAIIQLASASADLQGFAILDARANGGNALFGFGGNGGNALGGAASVMVEASLDTTAQLGIAGGTFLLADGRGGSGGAGDGSSVPAGAGGTGTGGQIDTPNQANAQFLNGASIVVDADAGSLNLGNGALVRATGTGGVGGIGGYAFAGLAIGGGDGSLGQGVANLADFELDVSGSGGAGGQGGSPSDPSGAGGDGVGGEAFLEAVAGTLIGNSASLLSIGLGGDGSPGGEGRGGTATVRGALGADISLDSLTVNALGAGGNGNSPGGSGQGGGAFLLLDDANFSTFGDVTLEANALGGNSPGAVGASAQGGTALFQVISGSANVGGSLSAQATARGGDGIGGGDAAGGSTEVEIGIGALNVGNIAVVNSEGRGGDASFGFGGRGGDGIGGISLVLARGTLAETATISVRNGAEVIAEGIGGNGGRGDGGTIAPNVGGTGTGGEASLLAYGDNGSFVISAPTFVSAHGFGGLGGQAGAGQLGATGGAGIGGSAELGFIAGTGDGSVAAGFMALADVEVNANGLAGDGGLDDTGQTLSGDGGQGIGGSSRLHLEIGEIEAGIVTVKSIGDGGFGANGGMGVGGFADVSGDLGGRATLTQLEVLARGFGGDAVSGDGGSALGGTAFIDMQAIDLTVTSRTNVHAQADGGAGVGGSGGDAIGGTAQIGGFSDVPGSGAFGGVTSINATATGGDADGSFNGGRAEAGEAIVMANGGTSLNIRLASMAANAFGGAVQGSGTGGEALGGSVSVTVDTDGFFEGRIAGIASAFGGNSTDGVGGTANAGSGQMIVDAAAVELDGVNQLRAQASGGAGALMGGDAFGGSVEASILNGGSITISPDINGEARLVLSTDTFGGEGAQIGDAWGGSVSFDLLNGRFAAGELNLEADAVSQGSNSTSIGGAARAGSVSMFVEDNSTVDVTGLLDLLASAFGAPGGSATGGVASLHLVGSGPQVNAASLDVEASASGADTNEVGHFTVSAFGGVLSVNDFAARALGDTVPDGLSRSALMAVGGDIAVSGEMVVDVLDALLIRTGQNGLIGGPTLQDPTAQITITSGKTVNFEGDNDNVISFGGQLLTINARDVDILEGARIGAVNMIFNSHNTEKPALIGADPGGYDFGFTIKPRDAERIDAGSFTFNAPLITKDNPNDPDLVMGDITAFGSLDDGVSSIQINAGQAGSIIRIEGLVEYIETAETDFLGIFAGERIEIVTPGGIAITNPSGAPGGMLVLDAPNIWAADADMIARLQSDPVFAGRNEELAIAAAGSEDPLGYIRARSVEIFASQTLLVRNTGTEAAQGGITVGDGGLVIGSVGSQPLDAFAYGRRVDGSGNFITGNAFFAEVTFLSEGSEGSPGAGFTETSEFNDCNINTGECPVEIPLEPAGPALTNPATTIAPVQVRLGVSTRIGGNAASGYSQTDRIAALRLVEGESNAAFGMDFPGLIEAPLMNDNPLLDDPVASGGDTTLYGQGAVDDEEDEDEDESEAEGEDGDESENGSDDDDQ